MTREIYHMIDIETTGVDKKKDSILEIGVVQIQRNKKGFWELTGKPDFHSLVYYPGKPKTDFAKKHMVDLYKKCNDTKVPWKTSVTRALKLWLHGEEAKLKHRKPKCFMGWNASNFDLEFLFAEGFLTPSSYAKIKGKEELVGDAHYRVYEQTGAIEYLCDKTGLSRKSIMSMCDDFISEKPHWYIPTPEGKLHDALYDCYSQINMMNALIHIGRVISIRRIYGIKRS